MQFSSLPICLFIFFTFLFYSCDSSEEEQFEQEIKSLIKADNEISKDDFAILRNLANNLRLELYENSQSLCDRIKEVADNRRGRRNSEAVTIDCPSNLADDDNDNNSIPKGNIGYQVYIENSGSMFGYMTGATEFKDNIFDLLSRIDREEQKMLISFINNKAYPILATDSSFTVNNTKINPQIVKDNINDFTKFINSNNARKYGDVSSSELNKIFKRVVEQIKKDGKTAIIVSDCIYSLSNSTDVKGGLASQKYSTKVIFQERSFREQHSVLMIQSESNFDGNYYNYAQPNKGIDIKGTRPFYTWIIGKNENMVDFEKKYDFTSLEGYKNHVFFIDTEKGDVPYYSILPNTEKQGRCKIVRTKRNSNKGITGIEEIEYNRDNAFQFSVGIDLSKIPAHNNYLTNEANYEIESSKGDPFEVVDVKNASTATVSDRDSKYFKTATHFITLLSEDISTGEQNLNITLKKQIPEWVQESSNTDDTDINNPLNQTQTFGLSYLISGVSEAYDPPGQENKYISIDLKLRR